MFICKCEKCHHQIAALDIIDKCPICESSIEKFFEINRKELISNIIKAIKVSEVHEIFDCDYLKKEEEINGVFFPSIEQIHNYALRAKNCNEFFKKLKTTLNEFDKYVCKNIVDSYQMNFTPFYERIRNADRELNDTFHVVGISPFCFDDMPKHTIECKDIYVFDKSIEDECLEISNLLKRLIEKVVQYMNFNNSFGKGYRKVFTEISKLEKKTKQEILGDTKTNIENILKRHFEPDLLRDGSEDINTMMKVFWNSLKILLEVSKMTKKRKYVIDGLKYQNYDEVLEKDLQLHYSKLNDSLLSQDNFLKYTDDQLISFWNDVDLLDLGCYSKKNRIKLGNQGDGEEALNRLVGLSTVKKTIKKIKAYAQVNVNSKFLNLHMAFYGNPGSGKTEVARLIAEILNENGVLPTKNVVEVDRSNLVGGYVGWTAIQTRKIIESALGGVLFIDEAYGLANDDLSKADYGAEAIDILVKAMEDYRGEFCLILAGYKTPLQKMIATNPGFASRIQFHLDFPNYSRDELRQITKLMLEKEGYEIVPKALERILDITDVLRKNPDFANAREVRNIIEQVIICQNLRANSSKNKLILLNDIDQYIIDSKIELPTKDSLAKSAILSAEEELDRLVGLTSVKKMIAKIKAYARKNKNSPNFNLHMCFYGNPGTGKTEVARILSRLLHDIGVLEESKIVETDSTGLIAKYVGQTGTKTLEKINQAMGGILFIDEAYALCLQSNQNGFGNEAIAVLLKEMEDKRGKFCVILAGYKDQMQQMVSSNPGFESRIQFILNFPDYSRDELRQIAKLFLGQKKYEIEDEALEMVLDITDYERTRPNYANARNLRNILDQVILNQNLRTEFEENDLIINQDVEDYISEKKIPISYDKNDVSSYVINSSKLKECYFEFDKEIDLNYIEQTVLSLSSSRTQGTGFLISPDGLCLSCNHCIEEDGTVQKARVVLGLSNGKKIKQYYDIEVIKRDEVNDIAIFRLIHDDMEFDFMPLAMRNHKYVSLDDFILAGYPFGGESYANISFTEGKIASVNKIDDRTTVFADMFGKSGNSGSPVIDKKTNKVIGIFWGAIAKPTTNESINCFTPIDKVWDLINN